MMKYRDRVRMLAALIVFFALSLAAGAVFSPEASAARASRGSLLPGKSGSSGYPDGMAGIEVSGKDSYALRGKDGQWFVESGSLSRPALASRVDAFLKELSSVTSLERIGSMEAAADRLGLGASAIRVLFKRNDGTVLRELLVGDYAPSGGRVYVGLAGKKDAFAVKGSFAGYLSTGVKPWYDLRLFRDAVRVDDIQRVSVTGAVGYPAQAGGGGSSFSGNFMLVRDEKTLWRAEGLDAIVLDPSAVERFARSLATMEAEDFAPPGTVSAGLTIGLELGEGTKRTISVDGKPDGEGRFVVSVDGLDYRFLVSAWTLKNALKTPAMMTAPTPTPTP
ncbi:MAG: DUF4340 domain-containing protein [Spirochaetes bacterium]|nr:DUF4340 domain-containing protein [Spirochaetota bacterium]